MKSLQLQLIIPLLMVANCCFAQSILVDADDDGIPDHLEAPEQTYLEMPLYDWGARPGQTDIFIEIDYMDAVGAGYEYDSGIVPQRAVLTLLRNVFAKHEFDNGRKIALHFDVGDLFDSREIEGMRNLGGGGKVPFVESIALSDGNDLAPKDNTVEYYYKYHMQKKRKGIFYYMLFGSVSPSGGAGQARYRSTVSVITLGQLNMHPNTMLMRQLYTVAHELGHNLGLLHGGGDDINYKPNYKSVMNYLDLYDWVQKQPYSPSQSINCENNTRFFAGPQNILDNWGLFSSGYRATLNEANIIESTGHYDYGNSEPIPGQEGSFNYTFDFNCDGDSDDQLSNFDINNSDYDVNNNEFVPEILSDHDDWNNFYFFFHDFLFDENNIPGTGLSAEEISMPPF